MRSIARAVLSKLLLVAFGLAIGEAALQLAAHSAFIGGHLSGLKPRYVSDPVLGVRGDSSLADYDDEGFRNAVRPGHADVVAIGDSQTEGSGVERDQAWPQQLAELTGASVYQLAFGGYGPGEYLLLVDDALRLTPHLVLVALYTGNDIAGMYRWVYSEGRDASFETRNLARRERLARADRTRPSLEQSWNATHLAKSDDGSALGAWLENRVLDRSKIVALGQLVSWRLRHTSALEPRRETDDWVHVREVASHVGPDLLLAYEDQAVRTVFTPRARSDAQNLRDPRIREGLRMTFEALHRIQARIAQRATLAVVLIPTKELVFAAHVRTSTGATPAPLSAVRNDEERIRRKVMRYLNAHEIAVVDPLSDMRGALESGHNPYFEDFDGHPGVAGHAAIAQAVAHDVPFVLRALRPDATRPQADRASAGDPPATTEPLGIAGRF